MTNPMYDSRPGRASHPAAAHHQPAADFRHGNPASLPSLQARLIARLLRRLVKPRRIGMRDIPLIRLLMRTATRSRLPRDIHREAVTAPVRGEWLYPPQPRRGHAILYLHGGGFFCGAPATHRAITTRLARRTGMPVFALDYRLAPEHPYPAALDDALAAWRWLLARGLRPDRILLAGDSAGGGLALSLLLACRNEGLPLAGATALFSPWTDLACTGASLRENAARCAWFTARQVRFAAGLYAGSAPPADPLLSPLHGDLAGLPPLIVHASDSELLRDDSLRLAARAAAVGVPADLTLWHGLPHAWPNFAGLMPEADACLDAAASSLVAAARRR